MTDVERFIENIRDVVYSLLRIRSDVIEYLYYIKMLKDVEYYKLMSYSKIEQTYLRNILLYETCVGSKRVSTGMYVNGIDSIIHYNDKYMETRSYIYPASIIIIDDDDAIVNIVNNIQRCMVNNLYTIDRLFSYFDEEEQSIYTYISGKWFETKRGIHEYSICLGVEIYLYETFELHLCYTGDDKVYVSTETLGDTIIEEGYVDLKNYELHMHTTLDEVLESMLDEISIIFKCMHVSEYVEFINKHCKDFMLLFASLI